MDFKNVTIVENGSNFVIVKDNEGNKALYSYNTLIAVKDSKNGEITLNKGYWNYSSTTGKHRNAFLNEGVAETRKKIKSGEYKVENL